MALTARIQSLVLLAWALVKTLALRLVARGNNVKKFNATYGGEGILSVSALEAELLQQPIACTACGRCDAHEGERVLASQVGYQGMMAFALAGARDLTASVASAQSISEIEEMDFRRAESLCPEGVPLLKLAQLVRGHARRIQDSD